MSADLTLSIPERLAAVEGDEADSYMKLMAVEGNQYHLGRRFLTELIRNQADPHVLCAFGAAWQDTFEPEPESWAA